MSGGRDELVALPSAVADGPAPPRRRRWWLRALQTFVALFVVWMIACVFAFLLPAQSPLPKHADVVVVLGPVTAHRKADALDLIKRGVVKEALVSIPQSSRTPGTWDYRKWHDCDELEHVICRIANPHTTQGEARMLRAEARTHHWRSAIVVTQTAHLTRAHLLFSRCFSGTITMHTSGEPAEGGWLYQFAYQSGATVKALLSPDC